MSLENLDLDSKRVLEVGSGRGDTTRSLVALLANYSDTSLTVTDISDAFFQQLQEELSAQPVRINFIQTDVCVLDGIAPNSIDYLACNYTLCAINAQPEILAEICRTVGFEAVEWLAFKSFYPGAESLDFFQVRLQKLLERIPNPYMQQGLKDLASDLTQKTAQIGGMEIPYYRLQARRSSGTSNESLPG